MKKYFFLIFTLIGFGLFLLTAQIFQASREFVKTATTTKGEVVRMVAIHNSDGTTYAPEVAFTNQSGEVIFFTSGLSTSPPSYAVGDIVDVLYKPDDPKSAPRLAGIAGNYLGSIILFVFACIFTLAGFVPFTVLWLRGRREVWLKAHGLHIQATVKNIVQNKNYTLNNRHPWQIQAEGQTPQSTTTTLFKSSNIWEDPTGDVKIGDIVSVYIDPQNPKRSMVDIDFLRKNKT